MGGLTRGCEESTRDAYAQARRDLIIAICTRTGQGRRCFHCQKRSPSYLAFEIDHLDGKGWVANKVNSWQRLRIMQRELDAGARLVASCGTCNQSTGATRRYKWKTRKRRDRGGKGYSSYAVGYAKYLAALRPEPELLPLGGGVVGGLEAEGGLPHQGGWVGDVHGDIVAAVGQHLEVDALVAPHGDDDAGAYDALIATVDEGDRDAAADGWLHGRSGYHDIGDSREPGLVGGNPSVHLVPGPDGQVAGLASNLLPSDEPPF